MNELKTLKDFSDKECYCDFKTSVFPQEEVRELTKRRFISETLLKAEAVKEINSLDEDCIKINGKWTNSIRDYIKWKNNLTEEDLK